VSELKRYTFSQIAKMECAECTTSITTTLPKTKYVLASEAEAALKELNDRLWAKDEELGLTRNTYIEKGIEYERKLLAKDEEIARLRRALENYGDHKSLCAVFHRTRAQIDACEWPACTCGLNAALDEGKEVKL